jgi:bacillithiol biosynthesis deacetylase BshB1
MTTRSLPIPMDVVAVGAHPDDVEIACGGTLARLVQQGYRVGIVDLTDGEPTPLSQGPEQRLAEAKAAAAALGVHERITLDLPNRRLFDSFEARVALAKVFRRWRPKLVIGLGEKTPLASPDHWQAMQITDAAVFYSRLTKWDEHFEGLPVHAVSMQLYCSLAFHSLQLPSGSGHLTVDISATLDTKIKSVLCYASQFPPAKRPTLDRIRALAEHVGLASGFAAGELLTSPRSLGTKDLMGFLFGG